MLQETCLPTGYKFYNNNRVGQINNLVTTVEILSEPCPKEQENHDYHLTAHQYQIINDVLRKTNSDTTANHVQVNQVGSLQTPKHMNHLQQVRIP